MTIQRKPHVHACSYCPAESAIWSPSDLPRGWVRVGLRIACRRCRQQAKQQSTDAAPRRA